MVVIVVFALYLTGSELIAISAHWGDGDYYAGGGSGRVTPLRVVTPLEGIQKRAHLADIQVLESTTDDVGSAEEVAREADVTIVVVATTSGESLDREDLNLDNNADELIAAVSKAAKHIHLCWRCVPSYWLYLRHDYTLATS